MLYQLSYAGPLQTTNSAFRQNADTNNPHGKTQVAVRIADILTPANEKFGLEFENCEVRRIN